MSIWRVTFGTAPHPRHRRHQCANGVPRKHTGERPFQCHCSRRFSRLDNLRQHAQTVHVNEDIPGDSLAATSTRFQRQIRTERVRPLNGRARASTANGGPPLRGHQRNALSTSSIGSMGSVFAVGDRKRPAPLLMAGDTRVKFGPDGYPLESPTSAFPQFRPVSPGYGTPTSATFSTQDSPQWTPGGAQSPMMHARGSSQSIYGSNRTPGRRLSVPASGNPFQFPVGNMHPGVAGTSPPNGLASPTASTTSSMWSRRDSLVDEGGDWRRRTWHPDSAGFTSRHNHATYGANPYAGAPASAASPGHTPTGVRLPGIESFDPLRRPVTPPKRGPSPMLIDTPTRVPVERDARPTSSWESGVRGMNMLDLAQGTPPSDAAGSWASETYRAMQAHTDGSRMTPPAVRFDHHGHPEAPRYTHAPSGVAYFHAPKRSSWHMGPAPISESKALRTSPDSNSSEGFPSTPGNGSYGDANPAILHANGAIETRIPIDPRLLAASIPNTYVKPYHGAHVGEYTYPSAPDARPQSSDQMSKLDALVAVATSGGGQSGSH